ncbi:MAG: hypothetical protein AAFV53_00405 [Myxococcota bacterium]
MSLSQSQTIRACYLDYNAAIQREEVGPLMVTDLYLSPGKMAIRRAGLKVQPALSTREADDLIARFRHRAQVEQEMTDAGQTFRRAAHEGILQCIRWYTAAFAVHQWLTERRRMADYPRDGWYSPADVGALRWSVVERLKTRAVYDQHLTQLYRLLDVYEEVQGKPCRCAAQLDWLLGEEAVEVAA